MADQEFMQDETLFDDMTEMSEVELLKLLIEDMFIVDGVGIIFKEFAAIIADVFENSGAQTLGNVGEGLVAPMRAHLHRVFKELELGDDMMITKSSDKELLVTISRMLRAVGDAIV